MYGYITRVIRYSRAIHSFFSWQTRRYITILSFFSMITSWVNVEHARLILPPHLVTSLAINRSKVFIGLDTMIQSRSVLRNHLLLRIFHRARKPPLKCDLLRKGIHVTNNGDIASNDARNFSGWAIAHRGVWKYTMWEERAKEKQACHCWRHMEPRREKS